MTSVPKRFMDWDWRTVEIQSPEEVVPPPRVLKVTEEEMTRLVIDGVFLTGDLGVLPTGGDSDIDQLRELVAEDLIRIEELGGTVDIPPSIAGE